MIMKIPLLTCHISSPGEIDIKFKSTKRSMYNIPYMYNSFYLNSCIPLIYLILTYNIELWGRSALMQTRYWKIVKLNLTCITDCLHFLKRYSKQLFRKIIFKDILHVYMHLLNLANKSEECIVYL